MVAFVSVQAQPASQPAPAAAPPPSTDIYLLSLTGGVTSMNASKPAPISTGEGYDNQPYFSPDGRRILFAANRDGKQIDIFVFDRENGRVAQLTQTPTNENSPTYLGGGDGSFSVVQSEPDKRQRLWRFNAQGREPQLILTDINPVGYHAWIDADRLALFVLGQPNSLQLASVKTGKGEVAAQGIGRSLHRIPGTRLVSFVHREASGDYFVKQIDPDTKKIDTLVKVVDGNTERDMAWTADGKTILMSGGTRVFAWTRGEQGWTEVFDAAPHGLGAVTRIAVSPKGDAVAIVVAEGAKK
jgi:Tol biopolymer transport system component